MRRLSLALFITVMLFPLADSMGGGDALDIQAELAKPGVKLLVVEFYATTCKPCMAAVPKWKALHKKYKKAGLRFIVVSAEEDKTCSRPPEWSPDETLCDADWSLMEKMGVQKLPASFLYSWEGKVAMKSHQVEPVEDAIRSYFADTAYKIELDQVRVEGDKYAISGNPNWVQDEIAARIRKLSKFDVVTASSRFVTQKQANVCDRSFPPNSLLRITLRGYDTGERSLSLALEKDGCSKAGSNQPYTGNGFEEDKTSLMRAIRRGVMDIVSQLVHVRKPEPVAVASAGEDWFSGAELAIIRFESNPEGATVLVDNRPACDATPCSKSFPKGRHHVAMLKTQYLAMEQFIDLDSDKVLQWKLTPDFGWLTITGVPEGFDVTIDGQVVGKTPLTRYQLSPGPRKIRIASPCCYTLDSNQVIVRDKETRWKTDIRLREAGLDIRAVNEGGDEVRASVYVDDKLIGFAPGRFKVMTCAANLKVEKEGLTTFTQPLALKERQMQAVTALLHPNNKFIDGGRAIEWIYSEPANVYFTKSEITVEQYKKCVASGACKDDHVGKSGSYCNYGFKNRRNHPVNCVDWYGAVQYCEWVGGRLPSEIEWRAEAANYQTREYPWGNEPPSCEFAVMDDGNDGCNLDSTWPVCSKPRGNSASGLCDMGGNVQEWILSSKWGYRLLLGGSWLSSNVDQLKVTSRDQGFPSRGYKDDGFRCAKEK